MSTSALSAPNGAGKIDARRGAGRRSRARGGQAATRATTSARLPRPARGLSPARETDALLSYAQHETGLSEAKTRGAARALPVLRRRGAEARLPTSPAARRSAWRSRFSSTPTRTCSSSTSRPTTSTSRAAKRWRTRSPGFDGTLLLISHDRALLEAVGSRTVVLQGGTLRSHHGGWAAYRDSVGRGGGGRRAAPRRRRTAAGRSRRRGPSRRARARTARRGPSALDREVEAAEAELKKLEDELADPAHWSSAERRARSTRRHDAAKREAGGADTRAGRRPRRRSAGA